MYYLNSQNFQDFEKYNFYPTQKISFAKSFERQIDFPLDDSVAGLRMQRLPMSRIYPAITMHRLFPGLPDAVVRARLSQAENHASGDKSVRELLRGAGTKGERTRTHSSKSSWSKYFSGKFTN